MNHVHEMLIALQQIPRIRFLRSYLNEILVPSPQLGYNDIFDDKLRKAIIDYKTQFNKKKLSIQFPLDAVVNSELWAAIGIDLGEKRLNEEFNNTRLDRSVLRMMQRELNFGYTETMKICDQKLAEVFGGEGSVVASIYEPRDLRNADGSLKSILIKPRPEDHAAKARNDLKGNHERGGIIHIYANAQGLPGDVALYAPKGFERIYKVKDEKGKTIELTLGENNTHYFYSTERKLYITFAHVKTKGVNGIGTKKTNGSIKIGNIGGPGGAGEGSGSYVHSHLSFFSEFFGNFSTGTRVDPRDYFCK